MTEKKDENPGLRLERGHQFSRSHRTELRVSYELAIGLLLAVCGFAGWLSTTSYQIGGMKSDLESTLKAQDLRLRAVELKTDDHEKRLRSNEGRLRELER